MQIRPRHRIAVGALSLAAAGALYLGACSEQTAGESIVFESGAVGASSQDGRVGSFTNARGWQVTLTEARVALGPVYFYASPPQASLMGRILGIRTAHACPAHAQYDRGAVLGEVLEQYVVDLLRDEVTPTGASRGEAGLCQMLELHLHPPGEVPAGSSQDAFSSLHGSTAWISGVAVQGPDTVAFQGGMLIPDEGTMRIVESIAASVDLVDAADRTGRATVEVYVDKWLENVDFSTLPVSADGEARVFDQDSQAYAAWLTGMRSRYSYGMSWRNQ